MSNFGLSIIIPVFNADKYLAKAIESALQFDEVKEILLIEDGSTDNSLQTCAKLATQYDRVLLFQHSDKKNKGAGAARNLGIKKARCQYVAFLDADDWYLPNRFDSENMYLEKKDSFDGMYGALGLSFYSTEIKEGIGKTFFSELTVLRKYDETKYSPFEILSGYSGKRLGHIHLNTLTINREILEGLPLVFNEDLRLHQDTEFIIRLSYDIDLVAGTIDKAVAMRGVHENNRITKLKFRDKKYYKNQISLWESLCVWAEERNIELKYKKLIMRKLNSFKIAYANTLLSWPLFVKSFLNDYKIIRNYRIYLKNMLNLD